MLFAKVMMPEKGEEIAESLDKILKFYDTYGEMICEWFFSLLIESELNDDEILSVIAAAPFRF